MTIGPGSTVVIPAGTTVAWTTSPVTPYIDQDMAVRVHHRTPSEAGQPDLVWWTDGSGHWFTTYLTPEVCEAP